MGRRFVAERRRDPYYQEAQRQGLRSRAAFKLAHLDERFHLIRPGFAVLDLGAAPGGWSLYTAARVSSRGRVVAVDPRPIEPIDGVEVIRARAEEERLAARFPPGTFDVVLSDMSPRISGAYATDHARSVDLGRLVLRLAGRLLRDGGSAVAKIFEGDMIDELASDWRRSFDRVARSKPPASRLPSSEMYLIGKGHRQESAKS